MKKVLLITNIPTPYRIPLFNTLNREFCGLKWQLKIVFGALGYSLRKWNVNMDECEFEYEVLPSNKMNYFGKKSIVFTYGNLLSMISKECPDVIITNGFSIATTKLWLRSLFKDTPYVIWSGTVLNSFSKKSTLVRSLHRKLLLRSAKAFIAYGSKAKEYLISLGAPSDKVTIAINTVDTIFFVKKTERLRKDPECNDGKKHLLYIGYLVPRKNVMALLEVIKCLASQKSDFVLDIVGDGGERKNLEKFVNDNDLSDYVVFHGYKQKDQLPLFFARSSCFLFQTDFDIWGLVLVEAMAAALPCIASTNAGATTDLIEDGRTGFAMNFSDTKNVITRINWILENPEKASEIGRNASRFISENANLAKSAAGFIEMVKGI